MKNKGFTLTELLIAIVVASITLLAITSLFSVGNRVVNKVKPVSETMEEAQSGLATLDFLMSRWGVGVPCTNCNVNTPLPDCPDYDNFPPTPNPNDNDYGNNPLCVTIKQDNNGNSEVYFFASLGGSGFVIRVDNNQANLISCRLSDRDTNNCYYRFRNGNFLDFIRLSSLSPNNADCSKLENLSQPNATASADVYVFSAGDFKAKSGRLAEGDFIVRAPHFIKLYVNNGWLMMDKKDVSHCNANENNNNKNNNNEENAVNIAKVTRFVAEKVGMGVKFTITFQSQTDPDKTFTITKYYSR
ncbi:MAG TPA: type II secretion system protein [Sulfurihydrogenibium azorense]|uniref:Type II secretion system protein n=1 Tax=Sulfurihydrogenibium azorense TaxID=309806 RepID=A0A832DRB1_9AQUI|nr:type II secretion system protein [Sulfurihydrogenibium azorense]